MSGLDKILAGIQAEADGEADAILADAKAKADEVMAAAHKKSEEEAAAIAQDAAKQVADIKAAQNSQAQLQRRQTILKEKQTLLEQTLHKALQSLYALPDTEYFVLMAKLAADVAEPGEGVLIVNEKDKARLPGGFMQHLATLLPAGAHLALAEETRPIDGGCVLKYGDVELNCSFADIFNARKDELNDIARSVLFAQ